jgi:hypothetical protein
MKSNKKTKKWLRKQATRLRSSSKETWLHTKKNKSKFNKKSKKERKKDCKKLNRKKKNSRKK